MSTNRKSTGTQIAYVPDVLGSGPDGGGNHDLNVVRDNVYPAVASTDGSTQYDTYANADHGTRTDDWIGYDYGSTIYTWSSVMWQTGEVFIDGGWFTAEPTIEVKVSGVWTAVSGQSCSPTYLAASEVGFTQYTFTFTPIAGTAIRVRGTPGGFQTFTSTGEMDVFSDDAVQPAWRRPRAEAAPSDDPPPRRRTFVIPQQPVPPPLRARAQEPAADETRLPRRPVPILAAAVVDSPPPRARSRLEAQADEEARARRLLAPIVAAVTPDNPPPRASTARARMLADESREEPDPRARKRQSVEFDRLSIWVDYSTANVNLTAIGTADWRTWLAGPVTNTKVSGGGQISDYTLLPGSPAAGWGAPPEPGNMNWTDGNPVTVGSHNGDLFTTGDTHGFSWTAPADTTQRVLHLYVSPFLPPGHSLLVTATLSDGSAPPATFTSTVWGMTNFHISYRAASPGQTLTVTYQQFGASAETDVRGIALTGPAVPNDMPFIRRLWQRLTTWDTEEPRARRPFAPIPPPPAPDNPPPRAQARRIDPPDEERGLPRPRLPIIPAAAVDNPPPRTRTRAQEGAEDERSLPRPRFPIAPAADNPPPRARARTVDAPEDDVRARRPVSPPIAPAAPPPRTLRRREDEAEEITGRRNRKLVPQPAAVVNNPPPRAGRSNWRVAWDSFEPVELLRKVYRLVFPGITSTTPVPPFHVVEDDYARTNVDSTVALSVLADEIVLEVSPMKPRKVGDNAAPYSGTLYSNGAPRSLAGSTVALWMWDSRTHAVKLAGVACTVEPSGTGTWSYAPSAAEVSPAGIYEYELRETTSAAKGATYPSTGRIKFVIEEAIG